MNLQAISKALAAALAGALVTFLAKHHVVLDKDLSDAVSILIGALLSGVIVYLSPPNKK
jgi:fructose-specific phosphotransferase system IIC component